MTSTPDNAAPNPQKIIAELQRKLDEARLELAARNTAYTERIAYQAAANDVLKVMSASPGDPQPVFDLIVERARDLCGGYGATVYEFDGTLIHWRAATGVSDNPSARQALEAMYPMVPTREWPPGRAIIDRQIIHIGDLEAEPGLPPALRGLTAKSAVLVPLMRSGQPIGVLSLGSRERGGFTDTQIELLKTFAEQAVIAITSAETFRELNGLTRDLSESLQQQTATADVLKVISRSVFDLQTVLDTLVESAYKLCGADLGLLYLRDNETFECKAIAGPGVEEASRYFKGRPIRAGRATSAERVIMTGEAQSITDFFADPEFDPNAKEVIRNAASLGSGLGVLRSTLAVPMTRDNTVVGVLVIASSQIGPFPSRQFELLQTFADQAVIAIENVRLFDEVQAKTADLGEALEQQTATAEVLKVISRSAFNLQAVLDTLVTSATQLCDADAGIIWLRKDDLFHAGAAAGFSPEEMAFFRDNPRSIRDKSLAPRVLRSRQTEHIPDRSLDPEFAFPGLPSLPSKSLLGVPLLRNDLVEGVFTLTRVNVAPFTPRQIALVESFADQAVIAISNVELFQQVQASTRELSQSLEDLRMAQDRLVQTEKLASLGQLTAGIAHEIKNPLNFVNNFSALSAELIEEMKDMLSDVSLDKNKREDLDEIAQMLKSNLDKVVQHGKRADSIVKNMLLHSRQGSGEHRPVDINAIVDESLNLAYHGARAENTGFNIAMHRSFDPAGGMAEGYPQEITRALLNLISNGFYAATKRKADVGDGFEPMLSATTKNLGDKVEIRIRDNGTGIPTEVKERIFNPFFTTKPAGEGTGLGLSMSHDIIVKQHGGTIDVVSETGAFTEFRIVLPRAAAALSKGEEG